MSEKKKIALIGCGGIGGYHLDHLIAFHQEGLVELVGLCDVIKERAENYRDKAGCGQAFDNFAEMCDTVHPDMCFICIPPYAHGEVEKGLIARGIHFFCEKPVALTMETAKEIRDLVEKNHIITGVGFQCRASSLVDVQRKFMAENKILYVNCNRMGGLPGTPWWPVKSLSGGQIVEQTIHNFDIARYLIGEPEVVYTVNQTGTVKDYPDTPDNYDTDDLTCTVVKFENGVVGSFTTGCYSKGEAYNSNFTFSSTSKRCELHILSRLEIYGESADEAKKNGFVVSNDGGIAESSGKCITIHQEGEAGTINDREFVEAVITGDTSKIRTPYADAVKTLAFVLACNKSIETGMPVVVKDLLK